MKPKLLIYAWEVGKWALVIYLIFPLTSVLNGPIDFARIVIGEALLIIFIGKIFYDTIIWKFVRQRQSAGQDVIAMIGILLAIGLILVLFGLVISMTLMQLMKNQTGPIF